MIQSINPTNEEVLAEFPEMSNTQIEESLSLAQTVFEKWRFTEIESRKKLMLSLAEVLRSEKKFLAEIATKEMGKLLTAAEAEVEKCAWACEYYANEANSILAPRKVVTDASESYILQEPLGVLLAIMPWNFPFWQVMRFAVPALMAGNVAILKHASNVPQSALAIQAMFEKAGFPKGAFQTFLIGSSRVSEVIVDPRIKAITLTGSEKAGSEVAALAGKVIKKTVLELGGSDPFIIFSDADIEMACRVGVAARLQNNGQSCIAAKRFVVMQDVLEEFLEKYSAIYAEQVIGDPMDAMTTVGPLATKSILEGITVQVEQSINLGAKILIGGNKVGDKGYFYAPTIVTGVKKGMPLYDEEVFGPVAAIIAVQDEDEAIRVANDSDLGLGASLWTRNIQKAKQLVGQIESGSVFVNGMVKSDPRLPFGGIKRSGYGRELADYGLREFVNIKTVWIGGDEAPTSEVE